jgi:multicomponent K+:H+ antiporter subunit E
MKRLLPFPFLWLLSLAMWLALTGTVDAAQIVLGGAVACAGVLALRTVQPQAEARLRKPLLALELIGVVFVDIVRSNVAVARIVLHRHASDYRSGFVDIPLEMRNPVGLAALACIITSTPGTAWAGYDSRAGVLTLHILDVAEPETWIRTVKERYERRLMEIFV